MSYPIDLPSKAVCSMEGHYFRTGSSVCSNCGWRVYYRCRCGRFTDESCDCGVHDAPRGVHPVEEGEAR